MATRTKKKPAAGRATKRGATQRRTAAAESRAPRAAGARRAEVVRTTKETDIRVAVDLDADGSSHVETGVPFLDHMLEALARHSAIGLEVRAKGDTHIDDHHTVEDVGITIGKAIDEALGDKSGITRFGHAEVPLDEALVAVTIDLSGRPFFVYNVKIRAHRVGRFDVDLVTDFMQALATAARMNLHINQRYGRNAHHIIEAMFKALARALRQAASIDPRARGVPSTKGTLAK